MKTELIFMGAPASGKGTQTKMLAKELDLPHIDTGSMLRAEIASGSKEGMIAKERMDKGNLVPTEIVATIIRNRLNKSDCEKGFILDGYPRNIEQAKALDEILVELNKTQEAKVMVINLDVDENVIVERIVNRRICADCGKIYNLLYCPSGQECRCDNCNGELQQRDDDTEEVVLHRIDTYKKQTQPLIEFYEDKNLLSNVNANDSIEKVYDRVKSLLTQTAI